MAHGSPRCRNYLCRLLAAVLLLLSSGVWAAGRVLVARLDGVVGPASSDYIVQGMEQAEQAHDALFVIELDTPGGLDKSMRAIIRKMLASQVPVAVYVTPAGARSASAGTYLLYAAHIAAMTSGTNVGAATPVQLGGLGGGGSKEMEHKITNDAVAYIRSLATLHGRNADWAERAVREAASIPAEEALKLHVVDYVAADLPALLKQLDGKTLEVGGAQQTLALNGAAIVQLPQNWRYHLLAALTDPSIAYLLMVVGFYGLVFELANPGFGLPGVAGAICILLALFAFHLLPVNYAGLALILLAMALFAAEAVVPSYGSLGIGGVVAFVFGSIFLMGDMPGGYAVSLPLIVTASLLSAGVVFGIVSLAVRARRRPVVSGMEGMVGSHAVALEDFGAEGHVRVLGETWKARCAEPVRKDEELLVTGLEGLTLTVRRKPAGQ